MHDRCACLATTTLLVGLTGAAHAQLADCRSGSATVQGNGITADLQGVCHTLTILGDGNRVQAQLSPGALVTVRGDGNQVRYQLVGGTAEAHADVQGQGDVVGPSAPPLAGVQAPASEAPLILPASGSPDVGGNADCRDRDVVINGAGGLYSLRGGCRSLAVAASGASVNAEMQPGSRITVTGAHDKVTWFKNLTGPDPQIQVSDGSSFVDMQQRLGSTIAPPGFAPSDLSQAAPLVVTAQQPSADCAGRDAQINAENAHIVLHGPCKTLTVNGSNDKVMADIAPGSRIAINGNGTIVQFAILGAGPDPIVSVDGTGSSAWRVQRLGASSRADASAGVTPTPAGMRVKGGAGASVEQVPGVPADQHPQ